jgi:hypothetical protein
LGKGSQGQHQRSGVRTSWLVPQTLSRHHARKESHGRWKRFRRRPYHFRSAGAKVTFVDLVETDLKILECLCKIMGIKDVQFVLSKIWIICTSSIPTMTSS